MWVEVISPILKSIPIWVECQPIVRPRQPNPFSPDVTYLYPYLVWIAAIYTKPVLVRAVKRVVSYTNESDQLSLFIKLSQL